MVVFLLFLSIYGYFDNIINKFMVFNVMNYQLYMESMINNKCMIFLIILMMIVFNIYMFKIYYMDKEKNLVLFNFLFYWFVLSMMIIIICNNWIVMILGWDMLGISSYLLIIFYNNNMSSNSSFMTMNTNRVGDVLLMIFISHVFILNMYNFTNKFYLFLVMMFICLMTKSAQFPFSSWLPLAMAAPTPVSSLVHSSTLVTAGLFILYKNEFIFNKNMFMWMFFLSLLTSFYSSLMASLEMDMKKMIALSTLSQLSFMFISLSMGFVTLSFLHLLNHAVFKASLFFWAGMNMHSMSNEQFFVFFNNNSFNLTKSFFLLVFASLLGVPFSLGFFSKDQIIDMMYYNFSFLWNFILFLSIFLTFIYTIRIVKKLSNFDFNKMYYKMMYFNVKTPLLSLILFSMMMLTNKILLQTWFKMNFLFVTNGWKIFFLIVFLFFIVINFLKSMKVKTLSMNKMMYLNLFSIKIMKINYLYKNMMMNFMDFGWNNNFTVCMMKKMFLMTKHFVLNKSNTMKSVFLLMMFLFMSMV